MSELLDTRDREFLVGCLWIVIVPVCFRLNLIGGYFLCHFVLFWKLFGSSAGLLRL